MTEVDAGWLRSMAVVSRRRSMLTSYSSCGGERLSAWRNMCAAHSEPMGMMFGEGWRDEARSADVEVNALLPAQLGKGVNARVFAVALDWVHSGRLEHGALSAETAVPVLMLAIIWRSHRSSACAAAGLWKHWSQEMSLPYLSLRSPCSRRCVPRSCANSSICVPCMPNCRAATAGVAWHSIHIMHPSNHCHG